MARVEKEQKELTALEKAFIAEYVKDFEPKKAALRAGFYENNAASSANKLLKRAGVQAAIADRIEHRRIENEVTVKRVLDELAAIGFNDIADYHYPDGSARPLDEIPALARRAIVGVEVKLRGTGRDAVEYTAYKIADKLSALQDMGKYLGLFKDQLDINVTREAIGDERLDQLLDEFAARAGFSRDNSGKATAH